MGPAASGRTGGALRALGARAQARGFLQRSSTGRAGSGALAVLRYFFFFFLSQQVSGNNPTLYSSWAETLSLEPSQHLAKGTAPRRSQTMVKTDEQVLPCSPSPGCPGERQLSSTEHGCDCPDLSMLWGKVHSRFHSRSHKPPPHSVKEIFLKPHIRSNCFLLCPPVHLITTGKNLYSLSCLVRSQ